jgi:tRNA threonylcarbamoyl adenosine modification protein YeaZ
MYNTIMKYVLAIESSTTSPTAALLGSDGQLLAEDRWDSSRGSAQRMFAVIKSLLESNNLTLADVSLFGIGLGPGNFTGLRTTLAAVQAMALPNHTPVIGISSAEAIASDLPDADTAKRIVTVGDARRRRLWLAVFTRESGTLIRQGGFELIALDDLPVHIKNGDTIVTPDFPSIGDDLISLNGIDHVCFQPPSATAIAKLAYQRECNGIPAAPLKPIYIHPPVFVKPRF